MNLDKILDPSKGVGQVLIGILVTVLGGLILYYITKDNNKSKTNNIKVKDNKGIIFQDSKIEGDINVKEHNKDKR